MTDTLGEQEPAETLKLRIDGRLYEFPSFDTLTYREARTIKRETGLVMGQFFTALENGDPDALIAIALIAKLRDNPEFKANDLLDLSLDEIEIVAPKTADPVPLDEENDTNDSAGEEKQTKTGDEPSTS